MLQRAVSDLLGDILTDGEECPKAAKELAETVNTKGKGKGREKRCMKTKFYYRHNICRTTGYSNIYILYKKSKSKMILKYCTFDFYETLMHYLLWFKYCPNTIRQK